MFIPDSREACTFFDILDQHTLLWFDKIFLLVQIAAKLNSVSNHKILCVCVETVESFQSLK